MPGIRARLTGDRRLSWRRAGGRAACGNARRGKAWRSLAKRLYIRLFELSQGLLFRGGTDAYAQANQEMFARYCQTHTPDGEITFLAVDPRLEGRGIGTLLLNELARRESGKQLYLYTDSGCTYQFYERRGFARAGEKDIVMELGRQARESQVPVVQQGPGKPLTAVEPLDCGRSLPAPHERRHSNAIAERQPRRTTRRLFRAQPVRVGHNARMRSGEGSAGRAASRLHRYGP